MTLTPRDLDHLPSDVNMLLIEPQDADDGQCDTDREANQVLHGGSPSPRIALWAVAEGKMPLPAVLLRRGCFGLRRRVLLCLLRKYATFRLTGEHFKLLIHFAFLSVKL